MAQRRLQDDQSMTPDEASGNHKLILLVSNDGNSEVLRLVPALHARGHRVVSLEAVPLEGDAGASTPARLRVPFHTHAGLRLDPSFIRRVAETVHSMRPDIVHIDADKWVGGHVMAAMLKSPEIPVILRRGAIGGLNIANPGDWLCYFGRRRQRLLCTSAAMAQYYASTPILNRLLPRSRLEVLHHHVPDRTATALERDAARQTLGIAADDFVVGTICAIRPIKGIPVAARALANAVPAIARARLVVIGSAANRNEVERIQAAAGSLPLLLAGERASARELLAAIDIFVSTTQSPGEGFGLAVVEAMLAERAIICSDVGAGPELLGQTGVVVPARDVAAWSRAIAALAREPERRGHIGQAARRRALDIFAAETIGGRLADIYERLDEDNRT